MAGKCEKGVFVAVVILAAFSITAVGSCFAEAKSKLPSAERARCQMRLDNCRISCNRTQIDLPSNLGTCLGKCDKAFIDCHAKLDKQGYPERTTTTGPTGSGVVDTVKVGDNQKLSTGKSSKPKKKIKVDTEVVGANKINDGWKPQSTSGGNAKQSRSKREKKH